MTSLEHAMSPLALVANARMPSQRAQSIQLAQVAAAFERAGIRTTLYYARRRGTVVLPAVDLFASYPVGQELPGAVALNCVDWIDRAPRPFQFLPARVQEWSFARSAVRAMQALPAEQPVLTREIEVAAGLRSRRRVFLEVHRVPGGRVRRAMLVSASAHIAGVIAISEGVQEDLVALGLDPGRIHVAHDGVDLARFEGLPSQAEARSLLGFDAEGPLVAYTGGLLKWKGVDDVLESARLLPNVQFVLAGGMEADVERIRSAARDCSNLRVDGFQRSERVPVYLAAADIALVPNRSQPAISSRYTSPLKIFESMAAGVPLVCSDLPSLRSILSDDEAQFVTPDDPRALAAGISALLADPVRRAAYRRQFLERAGRHSWEARAESILTWMTTMTST